MSFFRQLSQLVKSLEKDVEDFRVLDHQPHKSEADHEAAGQRAILTAYGLQSDVTQLQKCMEQTTKSLQNDGGFLDLVATTEALVAKQKENINQMEEYLQQYGYQPLSDGEPKTAAGNGRNERDQTDALTTETASRSTKVNDKLNIPESQERPNSCKEYITPEKTSEIDYDEIMRTPRLEDFGLSEERLNQYKTYGAALKPRQDTGESASAASTIGATCPGEMIHMKGCDANETMTIPLDFQHAGLCPTPGFTGGRDSTNRQDDSFPLETPQVLRPKPSNTYNTCNTEEDTDFTQMLSLPDPPVLLTPGVKQIKKLNIRDQPAPVLHMGDINEESLENTSLDDNGLGSPVLPVLCTPGVKQLKKPSEAVSAESRNPILSYASDYMDTPEMPDLTMGWIGLKSLTGETTYNLGPAIGSSTDVRNTTASDNRCITATTGGRINPSEMFRNIGKTSQPTASEDSLPEMPELTSTQGLNFKWRTGLGQGVCTGNTGDTPASPDCTRLLKSHDVDLSPLPPMPELTGTYNFSVRSCVVTSQTTEASHTGQSYRISGSEEEQRIQDKENLAPGHTQLGRNSNLCNHKATRFAHITEDEYRRQPDYVQRIVSLDLLNRALMDLEQIFLDQEDGGQNVCVTERDLQPLLESRTKPVILSLTKLGRLRLKRQGQKPAYVPAT